MATQRPSDPRKQPGEDDRPGGGSSDGTKAGYVTKAGGKTEKNSAAKAAKGKKKK